MSQHYVESAYCYVNEKLLFVLSGCVVLCFFSVIIFVSNLFCLFIYKSYVILDVIQNILLLKYGLVYTGFI